MYLGQGRGVRTQEETGALDREDAPEPEPHPDEVSSTTTPVEDSSPSSNEPQAQPQPQPQPEPQPTETPTEQESPSPARPGTPSDEMTDKMAEEGGAEVDGINVVVVCVGSEDGTSTDDVTEPVQQDVEPPEGSAGEPAEEEAAEAPVSQPSPESGPHPPQEQSGPQAPGQVQAEREAQAQAACSDVDMDASEDKDDVAPTDKQLVRAVPFDACIVSIKSLSEKERALHERLASEGEAGGGPAGAAAGGPPRGRRSRLLPGGANGARRRAVTPNPRIRCEDCGFLADGLSGLNVHISMKHPSREKRFHCLLCGKSFYTESNLHQHLTSGAHLRNEQVRPGQIGRAHV